MRKILTSVDTFVCVKIRKHKPKFAFTLAEVLITLGIIGIVAALTMPSLIANTRKKETSVRLKKFNSIMSQALLSAEAEYGEERNWEDHHTISTAAFFNKYFKPHIRTLAVVETNFDNAEVRFTDGTTATYRRGNCIDIQFDINGHRKPNINGKDRFFFLNCPEARPEWCGSRSWCPYVQTSSMGNRDSLLNLCTSNASYCSGLLEVDDWEFKDDYPHKL